MKMDEVLDKFQTTNISKESKDDTGTGSDFSDLYKNWGKLGNQEERRKELLNVQKSDRSRNIDKLRGILDFVVSEERSLYNNEKKVYYRPNIYVAGFQKTPTTYKNILMMSEWMIEKPKDFNENWYVIPCPSATRALVVANQGTTKCFSKYGQFLLECRTALPGGNPSDFQLKNKCCVLDCFYYEKSKTMYILDLLAWNNQPMTDGETEFRHYWLQTKLQEIPELTAFSRKNKLIFTLLPKVDCTSDSLNRFMMTYPHFQQFFPPLDGLLFYHKKAHYVSGQTPLVGWLYPYMIPEILGPEVKLNEAYLIEKPVGYTNQAAFIDDFETKYLKKYPRRRRYSTNSMDTAVIDKESNERPNQIVTTFNEMQEAKNSESESTDAMESENNADIKS